MRASRLYHQLQTLLGQSIPWTDQRHLQTLLWMVIGLICSECISLTKWRVYIRSRTRPAKSHQRRFSRWLHNPRINVQKLYSALIGKALASWGASKITLIEDTSMLWDEFCLIRLSVQYRGRAVPVVWRVIRHGSSSVGFEVYQPMLKRATGLLPAGTSVCFLADRGFVDTRLMRYLQGRARVALSHSYQKQQLDLSTWERLEATEPISSGFGRSCPITGGETQQNEIH